MIAVAHGRTVCLVIGVLSLLLVWLAVVKQESVRSLQCSQHLRAPLLSSQQPDSDRSFSLKAKEIAPLSLSFVVAASANACGVGGGAFFVPMFNILLGFSLKGSTALSQSVVTGGACAGFIYSSFKRHPEDHTQPVIDFDLALVLTPMLLLGITAGVLINAMMPDWLITVLLVLVLAWLTFKTVAKGLQLHQAEKKAVLEAAAGDVSTRSHTHANTLANKDPSSNDADAACLLHVTTSGQMNDTRQHAANSNDVVEQLHSDNISAQQNGHTDAPFEREQQQQSLIPWKAVQFSELTLLWAGFLALQYGKVTFLQCSWQYALLCLAQAAISIISTTGFIFQAHALRTVPDSSVNEPLLEERKQIASHHDWPILELIECVIITLVGGTVAGMLGFGGGMILNPLMLGMKIHPLVSSATSSVMVLFSASTATFAFAASGRLNYQFASVYGLVCAVASIFGVAVISASVRRSGRGSPVVFILAVIIGTGCILQAVFGGMVIVQDLRTGANLSFSSFC